MFTCISCRVAFETAAEQRAHFSTDWHRYNMKRRVANLPPVAAASFNEKVLERREQNAVRTDPRSLACASCKRANNGEGSADVQEAEDADVDIASTSDDEIDSGDDEDVSEKIANFRRRIKPTDCLFCFQHSESVNENVIHMARSHSFFIPDQDILVDLPGLLSYLGEKVAIGNLCLFCPNGGREFGSLEAVRRHMIDKAHCKLAYNDEEDRVELADFYDFGGSSDDDDTEWEDMDVDGPTASATEVDRPLGLAADGLSLMLPSGRTLGHRSLRVYYSQRYRPSALLSASEDSTALKVARVRQRLADSSLALVPVAGGHGAFGRGQELMKARNAGEAKWARRQARSFHDQRSKELHKTKMGFVHNSQKHFRDPLREPSGLTICFRMAPTDD
ncbi:hypothetical protein IAR55_005804 [Kwoniella newhampshirensis]|uniref:ZN622/Rei1/Reh1 zinc finger C2H2-type domain-containing protein n=1 Tax=Kwoniella newhampshirensis TaxID=1651941 RepID=A0AAW0YKX5_9TREE